MLPIAALICACCLGESFFARGRYLTGLLAFMVVSLTGIITSCYLEAVVRELLKKLRARPRASHPTLLSTHKPQPATSSTPS